MRGLNPALAERGRLPHSAVPVHATSPHGSRHASPCRAGSNPDSRHASPTRAAQQQRRASTLQRSFTPPLGKSPWAGSSVIPRAGPPSAAIDTDLESEYSNTQLPGRSGREDWRSGAPASMLWPAGDASVNCILGRCLPPAALSSAPSTRSHVHRMHTHVIHATIISCRLHPVGPAAGHLRADARGRRVRHGHVGEDGAPAGGPAGL
jgi:hypothetical protein